jgi:site-specific DNA recombinase
MTVAGQDRSLREGLAKTVIGEAPAQEEPITNLLRLRRIAFYARTSSEDQRERETIKTQIEALFRMLAQATGVVLVAEFYDDGVSGTLAMEDRARGRALLAACRAGEIDEVWVTRPSRIGRNTVHILNAVEALEKAGVTVVGVLDALDNRFILTIKAAVAEEERRVFLENSAGGMARAAAEGRFCGGIVPLGYTLEGKRPRAYLVPSDFPMYAAKTESDIVRWIFHLVGVENWSTRRVAAELNALGVPTSYQRDGRAVRTKLTQGLWRAGRIRNLLVNPLYKGENAYGKRLTKKKDEDDESFSRRKAEKRELIISQVPALVTPELWAAVQATLARNRVIPTHSRNTYLLRGVAKCGGCGLAYCGTAGQPGAYWYRCNGQLVERGPIDGRCPSRAMPGAWIDAAVWTDVERYLQDPGDILADLAHELDEPPADPHTVSATDLRRRLSELANEQSRLVQLAVKGVLDGDDIAREKGRIAAERAELDARLAAFDAAPAREVPSLSTDLLDAIRQRLPELTIAEKQEIVRALVKGITVHTSRNDAGKKELRVVIEYQFPEPQNAASGVVLTDTGTHAGHPLCTRRRPLA